MKNKKQNLIENEEGFTLLEMMFTLSVVVVMVTLVIPNFGLGRDRERLRATARQMESDLRQAQEHSLSQQVDSTELLTSPAGVYVDLGSSDTTYYIFSDLNKDTHYDAGEEITVGRIEGKVYIKELLDGPNAVTEVEITFDRLTDKASGDYTIILDIRGDEDVNTDIDLAINSSGSIIGVP